MSRRDPSQTPLMQQFREIKTRYPHAIVFFRLGDFYEMFYDDAIEASRLLDLTLTTRDKGRDDAVPMCGVPHHASSGYIARLTAAGRSVVVCEQVEDPKLVKGIVKRDVIRVVTPGITTDDAVLDPTLACYVASIVPSGASPDVSFGFAYLDVSTGEFHATSVTTEADLISELVRVAPREVVAPMAKGGKSKAALWDRLQKRWTVPWTPVEASGSPHQELGALLNPLHEHPCEDALQAAATVLAYARSTQLRGTLSISQLQLATRQASVGLDETAVRTLELFETMLGRRKEGSLLAAMDLTVSAGGGRLLRHWLARPMADLTRLAARHDAVAWFLEQPSALTAARQALSDVYDIERIVTRVCLEQASPPELVRLRRTLQASVTLAAAIRAQVTPDATLPVLLTEYQPGSDAVASSALPALCDRLTKAIDDKAPRYLRDGNTIAAGYDATVDELRDLCSGGASLLGALEASERARTGIGNLKIGRSRVFGFFIEVSKSQLGKVPADFVRRQTVAGGERYVTAALAELEIKLQSAEEKLLAREQALFAELVADIVAAQPQLMALAHWLGQLDVLACFAEVARKRRYVRPVLGSDTRLDIRDGRHPVIEAYHSQMQDGQFVANDCVLAPVDGAAGQGPFLLITGPNMAGKSTYMRQVALSVLLAQCGSFVPASSAYIGVVDRIFTRIGAADDVSRGESTFMVEMRETAAILQNATARSLILLDEIGRGTSTYDGLSIAWAVAEHLAQVTNARTLFATHYHELCRLADQWPGVRNVSMAVGDQRGELAFLRKVIPGEATRSYGIDVAKRAGLPASVLRRAGRVLAGLQGAGATGIESGQLALLLSIPPTAEAPFRATGHRHDAPSPLMAELAGVSIDEMTPVQAIAKLHEFASRARAELGPALGQANELAAPFS